MGWTNGDNKFGLSKWIVGPTLGDGVNYSSIQTAITDAGNAGGGVIYIRPGTYVENLTLTDRVYLIGASVDGFNGDIQVQGDHNMTNGVCWVENMFFVGTVATFAVGNPSGASSASLYLKDCFVTSTGLAFNDATNGNAGLVTLVDSLVDSSDFCIQVNDSLSFQIERSTLRSTGNGAIFIGGGTTNCNGLIEYSSLTGAAAPTIQMFSNASVVTARYNYMEAPNEPINFNASPRYISDHNVYNDLNSSSNYLVGPGVVTMCGDVVIPASSATPDPAATITKSALLPWCEAGAFSTSLVRGTAAFDSSQFTVTDGFVQLSGSAGITWVDQGVNTTVLAGQGNFVTAAITLSLPGAPVQGDTAYFKLDTAGPLVIQAGPGQKIKFGNQTSSVGGTMTSSADGDAAEMVYRAATATWIVDYAVGNWFLA